MRYKYQFRINKHQPHQSLTNFQICMKSHIFFRQYGYPPCKRRAQTKSYFHRVLKSRQTIKSWQSCNTWYILQYMVHIAICCSARTWHVCTFDQLLYQDKFIPKLWIENLPCTNPMGIHECCPLFQFTADPWMGQVQLAKRPQPWECCLAS